MTQRDADSATRDFWTVYSGDFEGINLALRAAAEDHPILGPIVRSEDVDAYRGRLARSRALTEGALLRDEWEPYLADLTAQGDAYAELGLTFSSWFDVVRLFRAVLVPRLRDAWSGDAARAVEALGAMDAFVDRSLAAIGEAYLETRERLIAHQQDAIRELSTPVLQLRERLLLVPLVGIVDTLRARQLAETLLEKVHEARARAVVIDITGVPAVDTKVANHLLQTCDAARLMGARVIVTGVTTPVALSLVSLGVDLSRLATAGDLQSGLEVAHGVLEGPAHAPAGACA